jgi:hypothetical protein
MDIPDKEKVHAQESFRRSVSVAFRFPESSREAFGK